MAADLTHLDGRVALEGAPPDGMEHNRWGGPPVPSHVRVWHDAMAAEYARRVKAGGTDGPAFAYLHDLRHNHPGIDPWQLLEAVAVRLSQKDG